MRRINLKFGLLAVIFLFSVASVSPTFAQTKNPLINTAWEVVSFGAENERQTIKTSSVEFADKTFGGRIAGCNYISFEYMLDGAKISTKSKATTVMGCPDLIQAEYKLTEAFEKAEQFRLDGDKLEIVYNGGKIIYLKRGKPESSAKTYLQMNEAEKTEYVQAKALAIAQMMGTRSNAPIPPAAIENIKKFVNGYAQRVNSKQLNKCSFGDNLQTVHERASQNAPFIIRAFNGQNLNPQIGLYLAMIESEHCVCIQSPTGPLGLFQLNYATAKTHFEPSANIIKNSSPANPDDRCQPELSATAAAKYINSLSGKFSGDSLKIPLAIGSYNAGEEVVMQLKTAFPADKNQENSVWKLIEGAGIKSKQFQAENIKYLPKFFAAAIVGENPQDFGLNLKPLSTYSN
jgi:heat shock protein HslJ